MSFGIKVKDTYACDSWQGIAWLFEEDKALRWSTEKEAEEAAKYIAADYRYKIVPLAMNLKEALAEIERLKIPTPLEEISDIVEGMKGSLEISFCHYSGWHAACQNKAKDKRWNSHDMQTNSYDVDWFSSADGAILSLLKRIKDGR